MCNATYNKLPDCKQVNEPQPIHPGQYVRSKVLPQGMSVTQAAKIIGVGRPALSNLLNGKAALSPQMAARLHKAFGADVESLMSLQAAYDAASRHSEQVISATTRLFVPPFLMVKAIEIESWADTYKAREQLAVLLRMLVHSNRSGLVHVDFPGNDDSQRPGWDGRVETTQASPWVPVGVSGWEFGTNKRVKRKADQEYAKRRDATSDAERRQTAFVFVTPRRWVGKDAWVRERRTEGQWRTVNAWDASDLEQWMEQSIVAQTWFAECRGQDLSGVKSLDACWKEWRADCNPAIADAAFAEPASTFRDQILRHLDNPSSGLLRIVADSRKEGLAFLYACLAQKDKAEHRDRIVVFTEPGRLLKLATGSPGFVPVITCGAVEREFAECGSTLTGVVIEHRSAVLRESCITLGPLSANAFTTALTSMELDDESIKRLDRESGRSLTVLRRRLARSEALRSPEWSSDEKLAGALVPMMLAGAWVADKDADRYLMAELAGYDDYEKLEKEFVRLRNIEDTPVWAVGNFHGVVSKVDSLFGVRAWMTADQIERFFVVAELVLSERDPSLDIEWDKQWASRLHGKAREISSPLRNGVAETLVLLAIHGHRLAEGPVGSNPGHRVSVLVRGLLTPLTLEGLLSQSSNLALYAEAAPETFLDILERDLSSGEPVLAHLMRPTHNALFERRDRAELLWALELLAWHSPWLPRVANLLASLAEQEADDNLTNKPSRSLQAIFRSWMPQTAVPVGARIAVFDNLAKQYPSIVWPIAASQFMPGQSVGEYSRKPRWRDYALGFGEPRTTERTPFVNHCIQLCLDWRSHTRETLADLMRIAEHLDSHQQAKLVNVVKAWAEGAGDRERAWLHEQIRVSSKMAMRQRARGTSLPERLDKRGAISQEVLKALEPADSVWKHWWLFQSHRVDESWEELHEDIDLEARDKRIRAKRVEAMRSVADSSGHKGVMQLAFAGNAAHIAGRAVAEVTQNEYDRLAFLRSVLADGDILKSNSHQVLLSGFLHGVGKATATRLVVGLLSECKQETVVQLLCLCDFGQPVWSATAALGKVVAKLYWSNVRPNWRDHCNQDVNYAILRLLEVGRPGAALDYACVYWKRVESENIRRILKGLPSSEETSLGRLSAHDIRQALKILTERGTLSRTELAHLEFLYLDLFWLDEEGVPNLELEIEANPELFCQAITLAYRREGGSERPKLTENEMQAVRRSHRLLNSLMRIPGHSSDGNLDAQVLAEWVLRAQDLYQSNGRKRMGDQQIGQLLSNAPVGEDGVWPCLPVREVLETVMNESVRIGFEIGKRKSRGFELRGEGGAQERELATQYEEWAKSCDYTHPKVATALRQIGSAYEDEARWHDQDSAVQSRLGY